MSTTAPHGDQPGTFRPWEGDHTDLVHVLWAARREGLSLSKTPDELAEKILNSRWLAAREAHAVERARTTDNPDKEPS